MKEISILNHKMAFAYVNPRFGSIKLNVNNAVNPFQIVNYVHKMEPNATIANHLIANPTLNNPNVSVLTTNMKTNKLKNVNSVTLTKTVFLVKLNHPINVSHVIQINISNFKPKMEFVFVKLHILMMTKNVAFVLILFWNVNFVIIKTNVWFVKMKTTLIPFPLMADAFVLKSGLLLNKNVDSVLN